MSLQGEIAYIICWIILLTVPIIAGFKRHWVPAVIYLIGSVVFLSSLLKADNGWNDLASFATLLVVVIPIYIVGTAVWIWSAIRRR